MQATVTIADGTFTVDFAGSAPAAVGPVNMPFGATLAMCKVALKSITTPDEPGNGGHMRPLRVVAEPGSLFHAVHPAPTFTLWTGIVALELIFKALAQGMPDRLAASTGGDVPGFMMVGTHPDTGKMFAVSNNEPVGWGATPSHDGANATMHLSASIVRNTPIEVLESKTTMLIERLELPDGLGRCWPPPRRRRPREDDPVPRRRRVPLGRRRRPDPTLGPRGAVWRRNTNGFVSSPERSGGGRKHTPRPPCAPATGSSSAPAAAEATEPRPPGTGARCGRTSGRVRSLERPNVITAWTPEEAGT